MEGGQLVVSADALIRIIVLLLYTPVCLLSYWKLIPRLSTSSKRLASVMLVAQMMVIVLSLEIQPANDYETWIFHLDKEWNIPTALASTQLGVVGSVALLTAWLARQRSVWQRLYLVGIALVFFYLARDEYYRIHDYIRNWEIYYAAFGAVVAAATTVLAARSPRRTWIWHTCLLAGLAISAAGSIGIEQLRFREICDSLGFFAKGGCLLYNIEEALEFLGIWVTLLGMLGQYSGVVQRPNIVVRSIQYMLPVLWLLPLFPSSLIPYLELLFLTQPISITYDADVELKAYHVQHDERTLALQFLATPVSWHSYTGLGYSVHLVDQVSGKSVAGTDENASRRHAWRYGHKRTLMYKQRMEVEIPPQTTTNRALWVVLSLWRDVGSEFVRQHVISSNHHLLDETQVVLGELVLPRVSASSSSIPVAVFDNGFTLEAVGLPEYAKPGETLTIPFTWRSKIDAEEDYVQFLHFGHEDSDFWWGFDQQPLGPRLPTRLWYSGLADSEIWEVPLPADLTPGRYSVYTGLYRLSDQERLPVSDADGTSFVDARVPLGDIRIGR